MIVSTYCSAAVYNNIRDVEGDRINDPERPLARGSIGIGFAWSLMALLAASGFLFSWLAGPFLLPVNITYILLGVIYSSFTKSRGMLSYITLVTSHIIVPLLSGYLLNESLDGKIMMVSGFMFITEVMAFSLKDYKDIEGDRKMGMQTLPIVLTPKRAAFITCAGLCLPLFLVWIPWQLLGLSYVFLLAYLVAAMARFQWARNLIDNPSPENAARMLKSFRYVLLLEMMAWWFS